ncbi:MAG: SGNH/GDSL hydrolase family protein [Candidatus Latescibacterota bacterium]|nr:MAG: SGNH/GDSL hydrolase family protein [Candidatus Latescibacterota bacterium]
MGRGLDSMSREGNRSSLHRSVSASSFSSRFAKNLGLSIGTLVLLFAVSELVLRAVYHPENLCNIVRFDERLGWSLKPNSVLRSVDPGRDLDYLVHINALGMRDREISTTKSPGTKRILITGDSIVFGTGVDAEWRLSDFVGRALEENIEVLNAGVCGWGNDQELLYYRTVARGMEPDIVVVVLTMANDVVNNMIDHLFLGSAPKPRFVLHGDSLVLAEEKLKEPKPRFGHRVRKVLRNSRALLFTKRRIDALRYSRRVKEEQRSILGFEKAGLARNYSHWSVYEKTYAPRLEEAWLLTEAIFSCFAQLCREDGVELIVFAFPLKLEVDDDWRAQLHHQYKIDSNLFDFQKPYRRFASFCERENIEFHYPLETFRAVSKTKALYFEKDTHPNKHGHALAARVLLDILRERHNLDYRIAEADRAYLGSLP